MALFYIAQIALKEPFWLQRRSHCSAINLAHVGEPWLQLELLQLPIVLYVPVFGLPLVLSGAKTSNGSLGSPKSSFTFFCEHLTYNNAIISYALLLVYTCIILNVLFLEYSDFSLGFCFLWFLKNKRLGFNRATWKLLEVLLYQCIPY